MLKNLFYTPNNILLAALVIVIFIVPALSNAIQPLSYNICFTIILLMSALSLKMKSKKLIFFIAITIIIIEWLASALNRTGLSDISSIIKIPFFVSIVIGLIYQTAVEKKVNEQVIVDSISGFLLMGIVFTLATISMNNNFPGAYIFPLAEINESNFKTHIPDFFYYTFVTFTTTGYGDILPAKPISKSLSILIATSGQLYVTIIIAMLVGKFAGKDTKQN